MQFTRNNLKFSIMQQSSINTLRRLLSSRFTTFAPEFAKVVVEGDSLQSFMVAIQIDFAQINDDKQREFFECFNTCKSFIAGDIDRDSFENKIRHNTKATFLSVRNVFQSFDEFQKGMRQQTFVFSFGDFQEFMNRALSIDENFNKDLFLELSTLFNKIFKDFQNIQNAFRDLQHDGDPSTLILNQLNSISKTAQKILKQR